jgi:predicted alpha/beta hydrolase family esterase
MRGTVPGTVWFVRNIRVAHQVGAPLAIHFDLHLQNLVSAVFVVSDELCNCLAVPGGWILSALVGGILPRDNERGISSHITSVLIVKVNHILHRHAIKSHVRRFSSVNRALVVAKTVTVAVAATEWVMISDHERYQEKIRDYPLHN